MNNIVTRAANKEPQMPGRLWRHKGTRKRNDRAITATLMMEYTTVILTRANISFFHKLSWFMVCDPRV